MTTTLEEPKPIQRRRKGTTPLGEMPASRRYQVLVDLDGTLIDMTQFTDVLDDTEEPIFTLRRGCVGMPGWESPPKARRAVHMFKVAIYAATTVILGWLLLCTYALATGQAAELHDLGTVTVDIIRALITEPVHDLAPSRIVYTARHI